MTDDVRLRILGASLASASLAFWFCHGVLDAEHADKGAMLTMVGMIVCLIRIRRRENARQS